jgi:cytochrome c oxidase assembly factor CtaG
VELPPYTFAAALGHWTFNAPIAVLLALAAVGYLAGVRAVRRRGASWSAGRTAAFLVLGLGSVALCTMSSLATYNHTVIWALAVQVTLLISIVPVCIAVGDPLGLVKVALPPTGAARWERLITGPVVRTLTFPAVAAVLAVVLQLVLFFSGLLGMVLRSDAALDALYVVVLGVGCLLALPLLGTELLPDWCTEPLRLLFAALDGLLDALPGIVVMTTGAKLAGDYYAPRAPTWAPDPTWNEHVAGSLMLALSELVALPLLIILFFRWAANETRRPTPEPSAEAPAGSDEAGIPSTAEPPPLDRPWWENEGYRRRTDEFQPRRKR